VDPDWKTTSTYFENGSTAPWNVKEQSSERERHLASARRAFDSIIRLLTTSYSHFLIFFYYSCDD
jgi:hypothetical protein